MGDFGNKFRKARESKELSLDDVSNVIKIAPRMLRAIEEENFDQLPGGVFNKGFIRSYAKQLGLDPEETVNEYLEKMRQAQIEAQKAWQPEPEPEKRPPTKKTPAKTERPARPAADPATSVEELPNLQLPRAKDLRSRKKEYLPRPTPDIPWRIVAVAIVVVILAAVLWVRHSRRTHLQAVNPPVTSQTATQAPAPVTGPVPPSSAPTTAAATPAAPQPTTPAPEQNPAEDKNDVTVRNFGAPLPKPVPKSSDKPTGSLALTVRASENSWISVIADGQPLTEETLIAPAHPTFRASQSFVVKVGNAAAVTFLWNGQELPAQGGEGEVKTLVFDSNGMHAASPSQTSNQ